MRAITEESLNCRLSQTFLKMLSGIIAYIKGGRINELVAGFGRSTFCKWSAEALALSSSLRNQVPEGQWHN